MRFGSKLTPFQKRMMRRLLMKTSKVTDIPTSRLREKASAGQNISKPIKDARALFLDAGMSLGFKLIDLAPQVGYTTPKASLHYKEYRDRTNAKNRTDIKMKVLNEMWNDESKKV